MTLDFNLCLTSFYQTLTKKQDLFPPPHQFDYSVSRHYNILMKSLPIVALIGQTNAGKSSLLNRLARQNLAIVAREEGTTRDNVTRPY